MVGTEKRRPNYFLRQCRNEPLPFDHWIDGHPRFDRPTRNAPKTALSAILLTGYLGGAIAAHVRHEDGWFPIVFCAVFGALLWSGLLLRDARLRAVLPWSR